MCVYVKVPEASGAEGVRQEEERRGAEAPQDAHCPQCPPFLLGSLSPCDLEQSWSSWAALSPLAPRHCRPVGPQLPFLTSYCHLPPHGHWPCFIPAAQSPAFLTWVGKRAYESLPCRQRPLQVCLVQNDPRSPRGWGWGAC